MIAAILLPALIAQVPTNDLEAMGAADMVEQTQLMVEQLLPAISAMN